MSHCSHLLLLCLPMHHASMHTFVSYHISHVSLSLSWPRRKSNLCVATNAAELCDLLTMLRVCLARRWATPPPALSVLSFMLLSVIRQKGGCCCPTCSCHADAVQARQEEQTRDGETGGSGRGPSSRKWCVDTGAPRCWRPGELLLLLPRLTLPVKSLDTHFGLNGLFSFSWQCR